MSVVNSKRISALKIKAWVETIEKEEDEEGEHTLYSDCVKSCLDESEKWSSRVALAKNKFGPYRIHTHDFEDKMACVLKCYYDY